MQLNNKKTSYGCDMLSAISDDVWLFEANSVENENLKNDFFSFG